MVGAQQVACRHAGMARQDVHRIGIVRLPEAADEKEDGQQRERQRPDHPAILGSRRARAKRTSPFMTSSQNAMTMT